MSDVPITAGPAFPPATPLWQRAAQVRYGVNWQWTAVKMQHERLMSRPMASPGDPVEQALNEYMRGVIDMDFFVTAVRRLLRVADQAKRSGCDTNGELKKAIKSFMSRWGRVVHTRNSLEHFDQSGTPLVPTQSSGPDGGWKFIVPGGHIDMQELFEDAQKLCRAIVKVIEPFDTLAGSAPSDP
jgi:hypothetical protein